MIAELGHYALVLALCVALAQSIVPLAGAQKGDPALMATAKPAAYAQFLLVALAFGCLIHAFVVSDFTVENVVRNSHSQKPMLYKVSGAWGNHEGSMVLWSLILALFGASVAAFGRNLPPGLKARTLSIQAMIGVAFLAFIVFTSNPFERVLPPPPDGQDLNPLLQDPGLAFHPPLLYVGYVGFSIVFAFAMAALIEGRVDAAWARWVRPWTLAAWASLTAGIALGSWWAYYELGWGGWWFWDPVENASFMPWLVGAALLHSAIVAEKRDALKTWTILLAILAFALSLIGTFLVRSGILTSVHAFAVDPQRGVFILAIIVVAIGGSLALYAWRAPMLKGGGLFQPISREGALVLNNLLLATATATVFIGTLYPLFLEALGGAKVSVGPPFFNATFVPLMVPLLLAVSFGPLLGWKRADLAGALQRLRAALVLSVAAIVVTLWMDHGRNLIAAAAIGLAAWLFFGAWVEWAERVKLFRAPWATVWERAVNLPRAAWGMTIAHAGVGLMVLGITGSTAWQSESIKMMRPGERFDLAGYTFVFKGTERREGPNFFATRGVFEVYKGERLYATMTPEKRLFPVAGTTTTEASIRTNILADLYLTIGDPEGGGQPGSPGAPAFIVMAGSDTPWTVRAYHNPLVPWIWLGSLVMVLGAGVSLTDRRHRVGAPRRMAAPGAMPAAAE
ncbi:MAG: heme lyase CcmF/NrfE family subunit [Azospirillum sp.]|nr:heme lyase CcmF/NrfE family subunit [Azospirillum sp.]MCZ8124384.1 heme lyase CcmF/NrfE family subunit [Magnetospirillum sp.]